MTTEGLYIPVYSQWDDGQLTGKEPRDFAEMLYRRALAVAEDLYDPEAYECLEVESEAHAQAIVFYLRRRAWAEWYFGVSTPARQITLLPDAAVDLKFRLSRQIVDEMRHHDVFSEEVRRRGGVPSIASFPAPPALVQMYREQLMTGSAAELAAANQYSGEVVLLVQGREERNILRLLVDEKTMVAIDDIEVDEPAHIAIGRHLVVHNAETPEQRRRLADAQERFLRALISQHTAEIEMLGSRRIRALPSFHTLV